MIERNAHERHEQKIYLVHQMRHTADDKDKGWRTGSQAADDANTGDRGVDDGNVVCELGLKDRVKVLRASLRDQAVLVCQLGKDANVVAILELGTCLFAERKATAAQENIPQGTSLPQRDH